MWLNWQAEEPDEARARVAELRSREGVLFEWLRGCMAATGGPEHVVPDLRLRDIDDVFSWAGRWDDEGLVGPPTPPGDPFDWRPDPEGLPPPLLAFGNRTPAEPLILRRHRLMEALLLLLARMVERGVPSARFRPGSDPMHNCYNEASIEFEGQSDVIGLRYMVTDQLRHLLEHRGAPDELRRRLTAALEQAGHPMPA